MAKVFIGLPVYNGEAFIRRSIRSVIDQTFKDWTLLISDNGSNDGTEKICLEMCDMDSRITYRRFQTNQGAIANFSILLDMAASEYFAWIAFDDLWDKRFLEKCVHLLDEHGDRGMAFSGLVNIDSYDQIIRRYPNFDRFADRHLTRNVVRFLLEPEIMGKANLIYAVYRLDLARKAWEVSPLTDHWGSDVAFILAALSRSGLITDEDMTFHKRIVRSDDSPSRIRELTYPRPKQHIFPFERSITYVRDLSRATKGTPYRPLAILLTMARIPRAGYLRIKRALVGSS